MANRTKLTSEKEAQFLKILSETANVSKAAAAIGMARQYMYEVREANEAFAAAWDEAVAVAIDAMETEARRRAVEGVTEPVFYQGEEVGTVRRYSDNLLMFLLKGNRPEKYKERHEHTGANGGPMAFRWEE